MNQNQRHPPAPTSHLPLPLSPRRWPCNRRRPNWFPGELFPRSPNNNDQSPSPSPDTFRPSFLETWLVNCSFQYSGPFLCQCARRPSRSACRAWVADLLIDRERPAMPGKREREKGRNCLEGKKERSVGKGQRHLNHSSFSVLAKSLGSSTYGS